MPNITVSPTQGVLEVFRKTGCDEATIQMLARALSCDLPGGPTERKRALQREEQQLAMYAALYSAARALIKSSHNEDAILFYPAAGLDFASVVALGIRRVLLLDREYFGEIPGAMLLGRCEQLFGDCAWSRESEQQATAQTQGPNGNLVMTFVGGDLEDAHAWVLPILGRAPCFYLSKGCERPSVVFPPHWISEAVVLGYAIDASGPLLRHALANLYRDYTYREVLPDRELIVARSYLANRRPPLDRR